MKRNSSLTVSSPDVRRTSDPALSDRPAAPSGAGPANAAYWRPLPDGLTARIEVCHEGEDVSNPVRVLGVVARRTVPRSEEHTSELQSLRHLVCRLLLEKKKKETETITEE